MFNLSIDIKMHSELNHNQMQIKKKFPVPFETYT